MEENLGKRFPPRYRSKLFRMFRYYDIKLIKQKEKTHPSYGYSTPTNVVKLKHLLQLRCAIEKAVLECKTKYNIKHKKAIDQFFDFLYLGKDIEIGYKGITKALELHGFNTSVFFVKKANNHLTYRYVRFWSKKDLSLGTGAKHYLDYIQKLHDRIVYLVYDVFGDTFSFYKYMKKSGVKYLITTADSKSYAAIFNQLINSIFTFTIRGSSVAIEVIKKASFLLKAYDKTLKSQIITEK